IGQCLDRAKGIPDCKILEKGLFICQIYRELVLGSSFHCEVNILYVIFFNFLLAAVVNKS
ncbi:MAG: hypothetical protein WBM77_15345, partial [Maribacter sp.]